MLCMRAIPFLLLASSTLTAGAPLAAQAVERTDTPKGGVLRVTFDPRILTWDRQYTDAGLESLGAPLTGDTIGAQHIPLLARLQQDVRTASGLPNFVATLGKGMLVAYQEKRTTPLTAELGITDRFSFAVTVPLVRVASRATFKLSQASANLGPNPLAITGGTNQQYQQFFGQFNTALAQLRDSIAGLHYGCPGSAQCAQAQTLLARGAAVDTALQRTIYGVGGVQSPFVPLASSPAGRQIDTTVAQIQRQLDTAYHVSGFTDALLLAADTLGTAATFQDFIQGIAGDNDSLFGWGYNPLRNAWRYGLGDIEIAAKYRLIVTPSYAAALGARVRLPTGTRDTTLELFDASTADHVLGVEGRVIQELSIAHRVWLNLALRVGRERPGTRARRVSPLDTFLIPYQATTELNWAPGDYAAADVAPLYRFTPQFAAGVTLGYWTKRADRYSYRTPDDSAAIATVLGAATPASVLDQGTSERWVRLGVALTYVGPTVEGGFTVERTVSGAGGQVAAATVYRLVLRVSRRLF